MAAVTTKHNKKKTTQTAKKNPSDLLKARKPVTISPKDLNKDPVDVLYVKQFQPNDPRLKETNPDILVDRAPLQERIRRTHAVHKDFLNHLAWEEEEFSFRDFLRFVSDMDDREIEDADLSEFEEDFVNKPSRFMIE